MIDILLKYVAIIVLLAAILLLCQRVFAYNITFEWDHNGNNLNGFYLYQNDTNIPEIDSNKIIKTLSPDNRETTLLNVPAMKYYYLTAIDYYNGQSDPSNVVQFDPNKSGTDAPGLRIKSVEETITEKVTKIIEKVTEYF